MTSPDSAGRHPGRVQGETMAAENYQEEGDRFLRPNDGEGSEQNEQRSKKGWGCKVVHSFLMNRWPRIFTYGVAVTMTSCIYAGWQQYSLILMRGGKYHWLCEGAADIRNEEGGLVICGAQERKIGSMFPIAAGLELLGAFFAGFALDHCGPRNTAIAGEIIGFIAILLMVFSTRKVDMMVLSMVLTGISIDLVAFPALILEDYFPAAAATMAAFVVACQSLSTLIAPIIWSFWRRYESWTFDGIWTVYLVAIWIPAGILYCITLPKKREIPRKTSEEFAAVSEILEEEPGDEMVVQPITSSVSDKERRKLQKRLHFEAFLKAIYSSEFIVLNLLNMVIMVQTAYYQVVVRRASGADISDFVGWAMPLEAVWGILLGWAIDIIKTPAMTAIILVGYAVTYLLMLGPRGLLQYFTASLFMVIMSIAYTIKYSFMQETYPSTFYGKLIGITGALGGVSVLLTNILTTTMTEPFWAVVLAASSFVCLPLVGFLWWRAAVRAWSSDSARATALLGVDDTTEKVEKAHPTVPQAEGDLHSMTSPTIVGSTAHTVDPVSSFPANSPALCVGEDDRRHLAEKRESRSPLNPPPSVAIQMTTSQAKPTSIW